MLLDPSEMHPRDVYLTLVKAITPRPIAWVSTVSDAGVNNLAPYSFFNGVSANPPSVVFSPVNNREGKKKDTVLNIEANQQFVINVVPYALAEKMNQTSAEYPPEVSEFEATGLTAIASEKIKPPRVAEAPVQMECELIQFVPVGEGPLAANLVIGKILLMHISDDVLDGEGKLDSAKLDLVGRMGGSDYCRTTELFDIPRPKL